MAKGKAIQLLYENQGLIKDPSITDNALHIDVKNFLLDVVGSQKLDVNVAASITGGNITRTMDGASTVQIDLNDHGRAILHSGLLGHGVGNTYPAIDVNFNGWWGRLSEIDKSGDNLSLTFEDLMIAYLRLYKKPLKIARSRMTRAQFIHMMLSEVKQMKINYFSPAENIPMAIETVSAPTKTQKRKQKSPGFHSKSKLTVKGNKANQHQIETGGTILDIGSSMGASEKLLTAAIATSITESGLDPNIGQDYMHSGHIGAFQQDSAAGSIWRNLGGGTGNLEADAKAFFKMGMKKDKENPKVTVAVLAFLIQYPGSPPLAAGLTSYDNSVGAFVGEAKEWLKQYNGATGGSETITKTRRQRYYFTRGEPDGPHGENTWDASGRLADEVNWHRFVVGNTFYYVRDYDLMKQAPIDVISESDDAVETIDFNLDSNKPADEATITCQAVRWVAHPGEIVVLEDCGPANGRWLVQEIDKDLFNENCTITVRQPHGSKKEPAPETTTKSYTRGSDKYTGKIGDAILSAGADRAGVPTHRHVIEFVALMAGVLGKKIIITTGSNHSEYTTSGNKSDHWVGDAADLGSVANHFAVGGPGGDAIARSAAIVLGLSLKDVTGNWNWHPWHWRGQAYRVQVGWKVPGHYDHVHVGVEKIPDTPKPDPRKGPYWPATPGH